MEAFKGQHSAIMWGMISIQEIVIRLLAALIFSGVVGLQRAFSGKPAGIRTHILVGVGAAIFTLISGYAFDTTASNSDRIAAQIVTGIGFIGGGAILKEGGSIKGLTTAAGLWAVAALGMAAGAGLYAIGIAGTLVVIATLFGMRYIEVNFPRRQLTTWSIEVVLVNEAAAHAVATVLASNARRHILVALLHDGETRLTYNVELPNSANIPALSRDLRLAGASSVAWHARGELETDEGS